MVNEIINELKKRSQKFLNWVEFTVNDPQAVKAAISYFKYNEDALKAIIKIAQIDLYSANAIDLQNSSLNELLKVYNVNRPFNEKEANNSFKKGLELIITKGYQFNGIFYTKGDDKLWI